jgi:hypothetical protein
VLSGPAKAADLARPLFQPLLTPATGLLCRQAVAQAEQSYRLPPHLLEAIALVESGRKDPLTGAVEPWPWTLDAAGEGHFYASKAEAIAAAQDFQAKGVKLIDVGCLQINLYHHPHAFASLEQAFDPMANAAYAAQFLSQLHAELGSWEEAAAHYHSTTPELAADYKRKVLVAWTAAQNAPQPASRRRAWRVVPSPPPPSCPPRRRNSSGSLARSSGGGGKQPPSGIFQPGWARPPAPLTGPRP